MPFEYQTWVPDKALIEKTLKAGSEVTGAYLQRGLPFVRYSRGKEDIEESQNGQ